jgi:beta-galactosidase
MKLQNIEHRTSNTERRMICLRRSASIRHSSFVIRYSIFAIAISLLTFGAWAQTIPISGQWRFALDRSDAGVNERWFTRDLADKIELPGALQSQGYGDEISIRTPWVLSLYDKLWYLREDYRACTNAGNVKVPFVCQPPRHYLGPAWYQRDIEIPADWANRRVVMFLERPHWESRVWLDDTLIGTNNSLCAPHEYELGVSLPPGKHRLTVRVDNRLIMPYRLDAHSVSDSLNSSWNGIAGSMELRSTPLVWIDDARLYPDVAKKSVIVRAKIGNASGRSGSGKWVISSKTARTNWSVRWMATWEIVGGSAEIEVPLGPQTGLWDEFHPNLEQLELRLEGSNIDDRREITFGLREFKAEGRKFFINGRETYLRGTHHGGDFPLTGYPPADVEYWRKLIQTCQAWGLNHLRFHSWCPPEAAFTAADELGFYLQPECGMWNDISPGTPMERMLYVETDRIVKAYGNHPSFVMLSAMNEAHGNWKPCLTQWVEHYRTNDPRRLYTPDTGWSLIDEPGPVRGADFLSVGRIGLNRVRGESAWFGRDYARSVNGVNVPVISHELGQWCAYPDFSVIPKFTGYMRPGNYEIFRDSLAAHGMAGRDKDFAWASGRFQLACYKEEIEANLRTPGLAGFQLLDLHDYVGQGTALVGLLDPFWEDKGYVPVNGFKGFCDTVVLLARLTRRVFTTAEAFDVEIEAANFGPGPLTNAVVTWLIVDAKNRVVTEGAFPAQTVPLGKNFPLGNARVDLARLPAPGAYQLVVRTAEVASRSTGESRDRIVFKNAWNFWLYPAQLSNAVPADVLVTGSWNDAQAKLAAGGKVLFLPRNTDLDWTSPPLAELPVFWNRLMNPAWGRMLGLWCDTNHPALAGFPTQPNCDWQWTQIIRGVRAVNLDRLPRGLQPVVQGIDDWNRNWKLGLVFECKVGRGRLLVCSFDVERDLDRRPVARQLRRSLLDYMAGDRFQPPTEVSPAEFQSVLFDTRIMRRLNATARSEAGGANGPGAALDGDPNTYWLAGGTGRGQSGARHPHALTVSFSEPVAMNGLVLMSRQNDRDHFGDVKSYMVETSDDGAQWREVLRGELASTWAPQQLKFAQTATAKQLRFTALSGFGNDASTALAELAVMYAGPKFMDEPSGAIEYRRSRSTSTDVDEGGDAPAAGTNAAPRRQ